MSESQKMFASLSGAFIAHLLLLVMVLVLPRTDTAGSSLGSDHPAKPRAKEVTVLMGDLMERLERERLEKEDEPEPAPEPEPQPPLPTSRPFVTTDLNPGEATAPTKARFESDRNTSAAARLRPDISLPMTNVPTLDGDNPLPNLTLANRDYVEGPLGEVPVSPDPVMKSAGASATPSSAPGVSDVMPSPPPAGAAPPVTATTPPSPIAPALPRPMARQRGGGMENDGAFSIAPGSEGDEVDGATRRKSFLDPRADTFAPASPDLPEGEDKLAAGTGSGKGGEGEPDPLAPETEEGEMAETETVTEAKDPTEPAPDPVLEPAEPAAMAADTPPGQNSPPATDGGALKPADSGLFAKAFSPEERQNVINGSLAKEGNNAVDAEGTPMGRYKKAVRDAISAKWHRYRQDNADFVTWGILKLEFSVDPSGRVRDLHITKNEANAMLAEFSLRAIRDAELPPMPADVAESVGAKGLVIQYDIIIY